MKIEHIETGHKIKFDNIEDLDPELEINRVNMDRDPQTQRVYLTEEKTDYRALAESLYNKLEGDQYVD